MKYIRPNEGVRDAAKDAINGKKPKSEVDYRAGLPGERCGECEYFEVEAKNKCLKVAGGISASMVCDLFEKEED